MLQLSRLPANVRYFLRGTQHFFRFRHHLVFSWTLILLLVCDDKATLCGLSRRGPKHLCEWHLRRFLCASYWCWRVVLWWFVEAVLEVLPSSEDGTVLLIVDGTYKEKTAKKHPLVRKTRLDRFSGYFRGFQMVVVMLQWGRFRIPIDFELVRLKTAPDYQTPNALFRQMLDAFVPPVWATRVIVVADAGFPAKETLKQIDQRGFFYVMSLARTWKFVDDRTLKNWVTHLPKQCYRKTWFRPTGCPQRRVYWSYLGRKCLRHIGDVTLVLSRKRRNDSPKHTKILVTHLPKATAQQVIALYTRRWEVELLIKELKGVTGLGQAQVTKDPQRVERAVALSLMAYLLLIRFRYGDIPDQGPWSAFTLKRNFTWQMAQQQIEHTVHLKRKKVA